jgi:hypothetical protein
VAIHLFPEGVSRATAIYLKNCIADAIAFADESAPTEYTGAAWIPRYT